MNPPIDQLTPQGYDLTFGTNVIAHFLFLRLLYPLLASSTSPTSPSRVVWVASSGHYYAYMDYDTLRDGPARRTKSTFYLYAQSKLAQVMLAYHMRKQCGEDGILVSAVDPGNVRSEVRRTTPFLTRMLIYAGQVRYRC